MRKKASKTPLKRGPGRPRKNTTASTAAAAPKARAKKKARGRPRKDGLIKSAAKKVGRAGKGLAAAATSSLFGTVHGLARWVPEKGDLLITKTAGAFRLGNKSWRRDKEVPLSALVEAQPPPVAQDGQPVKRPRGRPRKVTAQAERVIAIKDAKPRKSRISPEASEAIEQLGDSVRRVVQG